MNECLCPVCGQEFKTPQGRGGHLLHATDAPHKLHRFQRQLEARLASAAAAASVSASPAPAPAPVPPAPPAPAPPPPAPAPTPLPAAAPAYAYSPLRPLRDAYRPMAFSPAPPPTSPTPAAPAPVAPPVSARDFLKPTSAALAGAILGTAVAGEGHRGVGLAVGACAGLLAYWCIQQARREAPAAPPAPREPPMALPEAWRSVLVPEAWR